jgi:hypothetical protein
MFSEELLFLMAGWRAAIAERPLAAYIYDFPLAI